MDELADRLVSNRPVPYFRDQKLFVRADAVSEIRAELSKHQTAPNPVGSFYFWNRTRVVIAAMTFGLLRPRGQQTIAPYLDRDLWSFLASLPADLMLDHSFHRDTVARAYPDFAAYPFFETKTKIGLGVLRVRALGLLRYLLSSRPSFEQTLMVMRTMRALIDPRRTSDIGYLIPLSVYCTQLRRIAGQRTC